MQVFISYARQDEELAREVLESLENSLREKGKLKEFRVFLSANLPLGGSWAEEIDKALRESHAMIVLVTPHAGQSDLVAREIEYALGSEQYKGRLFPIAFGSPDKFLRAGQVPWVLQNMPWLRLPTLKEKRQEKLAGVAEEIASHLIKEDEISVLTSA